MEITLDEAVQQLFVIAEELSALNEVTGAMVLERITHFYETRIEGAVVEDDGDMLLLQWGATKALLIDEPKDFRMENSEFKFEEHKRHYLDFTRQILVESEDETTDFDSEAIQISLTLYYCKETENTPSGNLWIESPKAIGRGKIDFTENEFVSSLLNLRAVKITAVAGLCG